MHRLKVSSRGADAAAQEGSDEEIHKQRSRRSATSSVRVNIAADAAVGAGAVAQAILGLEFVLGGLNKYLATNFAAAFKSFVASSASAQGDLLTPIVRTVIVPNSALFAELARLTELLSGIMLLIAAGDTLRRHFARGRGRTLEASVSLLGAVAAVAVGGLSLTIYLLKGGTFPGVDPKLALAPPLQVELVNVALAIAVAWLGIGRFLALGGDSVLLSLKWHPKWLLGLFALLGTIVSLTACGGSVASGPPAGSIRVTMTDYRFSPDALEVKADGTSFYLVNSGGQIHDMVIADSGGHVIARSDPVSPGDTASFAVSNLQPGDYAVYCDVPGHKESGMVGTLKVDATSQ